MAFGMEVSVAGQIGTMEKLLSVQEGTGKDNLTLLGTSNPARFVKSKTVRPTGSLVSGSRRKRVPSSCSMVMASFGSE